MTSPLKKYILPAFLLPSAVFAAATLPLAVLSTQQVAVEIQKETIFTGQLRDIAPPYLAAATAVSVTVGIAGVAVTGWKQSKSKSSELEAQLEEQQNALSKKEAQIEELKLSPSVLEAWGLNSFVEKSRPEPQPVMATSATEMTPEISVQIEEVPEPQPVMATSRPEMTPEISVQIEEVPEPETQSPSPHLNVLQFPTAAVTAPTSSNADEIQTRLQQLQTQIETLQQAVSSETQSASFQQAVSSETQSASFQLKVPDMRQITPQHKVAV